MCITSFNNTCSRYTELNAMNKILEEYRDSLVTKIYGNDPPPVIAFEKGFDAAIEVLEKFIEWKNDKDELFNYWLTNVLLNKMINAEIPANDSITAINSKYYDSH